MFLKGKCVYKITVVHEAGKGKIVSLLVFIGKIIDALR